MLLTANSTHEIKFKTYRLLKKLYEIVSLIHGENDLIKPLIIDTCMLMSLNDFEISYWAIIVEKTLTLSNQTDMESYLTFTAFSAKKYSNRDTIALSLALEKKFQHFNILFTSWTESNIENIRSTPQEINKMYQKLSKCIEGDNDELYIDYGKIVDGIVDSWIKIRDDHATDLDKILSQNERNYGNNESIIGKNTRNHVKIETAEQIDDLEITENITSADFIENPQNSKESEDF